MRALVVALLVAGLFAPDARAAAPVDDRAGARELSFAAYRLRVAIKAATPEILRRQQTLGTAECVDAVLRAPRRVRDEVGDTHEAAVVLALLDDLRPLFATFVTELDRVPAEDRALRRGRRAWRTLSDSLIGLPAVPPDLCAQFARWRRSGYAPSARPAVDVEAAQALPIGEEGAGLRLERRWRAAARRMRTLGVSRSAAERFVLEKQLDGVV